MEDTTQVVTAVNGVQFKPKELINEASSKPDVAVNGDPIKPETNVNGTSTGSNATVDIASPKNGTGGNGRPRGPTRSQQINKLYSYPTPLRTFPLPTFVPHNPISLVQILYTWLQQTISPPSSHPQALYQGVFSPELRSIHVTDERSAHALWREGFFGKGSLSRSEPSWLDREKRRVGANASKTSEEVTRQRRAERQQAKWERARVGREAIDQKLREEQELGILSDAALRDNKDQPTRKTFLSPVGPEELLRLPNSRYDVHLVNGPTSAVANTTSPGSERANEAADDNKPQSIRKAFVPPVGPGELLRLSNSQCDLDLCIGPTSVANHTSPAVEQSVTTVGQDKTTIPNGHVVSPGYESPPATEVDLLLRPLYKPVSAKISGDTQTYTSTNSDVSTEETLNRPKPLNRKKSVRFSPTIEQTTFLPSDPINADFSKPKPPTPPKITEADVTLVGLHNQEHIQLTMEEAFFLSYGLGVLSIQDAHSNLPIPPQDLLPLFRQTSSFPVSATPHTRPDDLFIISYVVYHHFRSLGWCVRGGTKFGVDYLLYSRGPVFSHAEFAVLILPTYSHPYWSSDDAIAKDVQKRQSKKWNWLHCVNRVNGQVKKTLVLVYVDVPPPVNEEGMRVDEVLARYTVREVVLKRWLSNRSRD
ncbi:tRNA splicing endonuclease subunit sen2 [Pseudogymnoascus destructans]|uniref:tRNA-intron lyase n=2 Tax=Pseudogymnoascus destructans TaxID=655981 RepID=L8G188_PSED2|nr:tRNA splicing endonuclease subunit sen2 [Pseudogymnoascus destructans]ELR05706.1 hypothetical protein GMDG_07549 [Pseudogymnoascus destructans 20631-21]OAF61917.1 tRNA splicing endonuclease subunit sen2 [Pseudogymnoascus destructans]